MLASPSWTFTPLLGCPRNEGRLTEALGASSSTLERFEREAKIAGSLNHPNVVALYDVGVHDGKPYFVTELLQGESLRERLVKGAVPFATALEWAVQMALGLAAAHDRSIVHRDLKPENVFITRDGHLKLLDFGIAKFLEVAQAEAARSFMDETVSPTGGNTGTGIVLGTPGFMSPEQVRADAIDARTDFFSFGAVLYEMLSGRRAFAEGSVVERGYATLHAEPEPLSAGVPSPVAQAVRRCLEKDPGRRFQSARDLAFHLELLRSPTGSSISTAPPEAARPTSFGRRLRLPLVGALTGVALVGATYGAVRASLRPMPLVEQITFRQGRVSAARFTPEGRVVFSAGWGGEPLEIFARAPGSADAQASGLRSADLLAVSAKGELAVLLNTKWYGAWRRGTLAVVWRYTSWAR